MSESNSLNKSYAISNNNGSIDEQPDADDACSPDATKSDVFVTDTVSDCEDCEDVWDKKPSVSFHMKFNNLNV